MISRQALDAPDGATLCEDAFVLRWFDDDHGDRLLVVNLDRELRADARARAVARAAARTTLGIACGAAKIRATAAMASRSPVEDGGRVPGDCRRKSAVLLVREESRRA